MPSSCSAVPGSHARPTRSRDSRRWPRCRCSGTWLVRPRAAGCPLRVLVNDPLAGVAAERGPRHGPPSHGHARATGAFAHRRRRGGPSGVERAGDDRPCPPGRSAGPRQRARGRDAAARGTAQHGGGSLIAGTAEAAQAPAPLLADGGVLLGPELFRPPRTCAPTSNERTMVMAANRLCWRRSPCSPSAACCPWRASSSRPTCCWGSGVREASDHPGARHRASGCSCSPTSSSSTTRSVTLRGGRHRCGDRRRGGRGARGRRGRSPLRRGERPVAPPRRPDRCRGSSSLGMAAVLVAGLRPGAGGRVGPRGRLDRQRADAPDRRDALRAALRDDALGAMRRSVDTRGPRGDRARRSRRSSC